MSFFSNDGIILCYSFVVHKLNPYEYEETTDVHDFNGCLYAIRTGGEMPEVHCCV